MSVLAQKQRYGQCGVVILLQKPLREKIVGGWLSQHGIFSFFFYHDQNFSSFSQEVK